VTFGAWPEADLRLTSWRTAASSDSLTAAQEFTVNDRFLYRLNVPGRHNVFNAMAAIGVARRFGMRDEQIADRLAGFRLPPMRLGYERAGPVTLINDSYNANPASVTAAVEVLEQTPSAGRRIVVLGDMRELGESAGRLHEEVAERLGHGELDMVIAVGEHARLVRDVVRRTSGRRIEVHAYASTDLARRRVAGLLAPGDTILVKGSRLLALERVVDVIRRQAGAIARRRSCTAR
jgi:UDP-N-acetylmuramoyl-tripeptide--D-alanyl-D-alanine ligase